VWGLIASMYVGNLMLLVLNPPLVGLFARILYIPPGIILVLILGIAAAGVYSFNTDTLDLFMALLFGVVGTLFRLLDVPKAPLVFGLILEAKLEQSFRQAMTISDGDIRVFLHSPIAATLLCCAAGVIVASIWAKRRQRLAPSTGIVSGLNE
jgi:putative tricarboxylic transport membrane protein